MICHISWKDWYSGGANQDCMPLQWAQKVCIHGLIQYHVQNIDLPLWQNCFPGIEDPSGLW